MQVINHGVSASLLEDLKREIFNFFQQPLEEKKKLWQQPDNHEGFGQLFVVSEQQKLDWSDMFFITTLPPTLRKTQLFENLPPQLRFLSLSLSLSQPVSLSLRETLGGHCANNVGVFVVFSLNKNGFMQPARIRSVIEKQM